VLDPTPFQRQLFDGSAASFDEAYAAVGRIDLGEGSWADHGEGWVSGADGLFQALLGSRRWAQRTRRMYDAEVLEPRLTDSWREASGTALEPELLERMRRSLSERYAVRFDSVGFNLYRDGRDSVAWHRDRISRDVRRPVIALVSLGERRKLLLRPRAGGRSRAFLLGRGDLLVLGGWANERWEHAIPKVPRAGPRMSLAFRHGLAAQAYDSSP
jgi:alkylated DNA repair dioxygenase AlkB